MQETDDTDESVDESWEEPHVPTLTGIGVASPASTRGGAGGNDPEQDEASLTPAARERRKKKRAAQQKALEEKRAFAAAQQKKKVPAAAKTKTREKGEKDEKRTRGSDSDEDPSPASSVRPAGSARRSATESLSPSDVRKIEREARLQSQTKLLFAFAALVIALLAIGFYLH